YSQVAGSGAPRLHRIEGRDGRAQESAILGLPPRVDDDGFPLADDLVVPPPRLRLDGLPDRGHVLEVIVVLLRLVRADLPEHADCGGRRVKDIYIELFCDPPWPSGIRIVGSALVEDACGGQGERPINDVRVPGDPADVGHAP